MAEIKLFLADQELCAIARAYSRTSKHPVLFGTMVTGEQFIEDEKERKSIRNLTPSPQTWKRPALPMSAM